MIRAATLLCAVLVIAGCGSHIHCEVETEEERLELIYDGLLERYKQEEAMKHTVFSVFDQKANAYLPPFVLHNEAMAIRAVGDACEDQNHNFGKHPEDYSLFKIGVFDDEKGEIEPFMGPQFIGTGLQFRSGRKKEREEQQDEPIDVFGEVQKG